MHIWRSTLEGQSTPRCREAVGLYWGHQPECKHLSVTNSHDTSASRCHTRDRGPTAQDKCLHVEFPVLGRGGAGGYWGYSMEIVGTEGYSGGSTGRGGARGCWGCSLRRGVRGYRTTLGAALLVPGVRSQCGGGTGGFGVRLRGLGAVPAAPGHG